MEDRLAGRHPAPEPTLEEGRKINAVRVDYSAKYEAFGSDDIHKHSKSEETREKPKKKPFLHGFGKAIAKSIKGIIGEKTSKGLRQLEEGGPEVGARPPASSGGPDYTSVSRPGPRHEPVPDSHPPGFGPESQPKPRTFRPPGMDEP